MRGLLRPCRHQLDPQLRERWRAHLCGLCLTLRDTAGQAARVLTGYDVLLLSVLVEAQQGALPRDQAGPCPLRGFAPASVVAAGSDAARLAAAGALLAGAAGLEDKVEDGDLARAAHRPAARSARHLRRAGALLAGRLGLDADLLDAAGREARHVEHLAGPALEDLLAPAGRAVAGAFAHTAVVAGRPGNAAPLRRAGDAFGRLVHLADAVQDLPADAAAGRFNPLLATATPAVEAARLAAALRDEVRAALAASDLAERALVDALFGPVLDAAVRRLDPVPAQRAAHRAPVRDVVSLLAATAAAAATLTLGVFGSPRRRRRGPYGYGPYGPGYGYDPYADPRLGYGRRYRSAGPGPGCCGLLACDCCASSCGSAATGDDVCCCCI